MTSSSLTFFATSTAHFNYSNTTSFYFLDDSCKIFANSNETIINDYEGIPENLLINVGVWLGLLILFTFIRRIGNYGRLGLINIVINKEDDMVGNKQTVYVTPNNIGSINSLASHEIPQSNEFKEIHILSWIVHMFKLRDKHIRQKCGSDAIHYLVFQRYLIVYMLIITILSVSILLPINLYGSEVVDYKAFASATIVNIKSSSGILWVHLIFSWIYMVLGFIFIWIFSRRNQYAEAEYISRTVLITNYSKDCRNEEVVYKHFEEAYPELKINDIQFAYDINNLAELEKKMFSVLIGKRKSQKMFDKDGERPEMYTFHCGNLVQICPCACCNLKKSDSIDYYTQEELKLTIQIDICIEKTFKRPLGVLFITFENRKMADLFLRYYNLGYLNHLFKPFFSKNKILSNCFIFKQSPRDSTVAYQIGSNKWLAKYAPAPNNIKWTNLSKSGILWWIRILVINIIFIILTIFFTTPSILIEKLAQPFQTNSTGLVHSSNYLNGVLPSLLLRLIASLLPVIVAYTSVFESHWTNSAETRSVLIKTYVFFIFTVMILPTLGLTSINAIFEFVIRKFSNEQNISDDIKWRCVSYNGAFFVKYVTTCTFIGLSLEIVRFFDLFLYLIKILWAKSPIEREAVRKKVVFQFDYGFQYAQLLIVFTVSLCFSVVCPLITPFCLIFLISKQFVDRYNIYFGYISSKVDKTIHASAVTFTVFSIILLQICVFLFIAIRRGGKINDNPIAIVQLVVISILLVGFFGRLFSNTFDCIWKMIFFKRLKNILKYEHSTKDKFKQQKIVELTETKTNRKLDKSNKSSPFIPDILKKDSTTIKNDILRQKENEEKRSSYLQSTDLNNEIIDRSGRDIESKKSSRYDSVSIYTRQSENVDIPDNI